MPAITMLIGVMLILVGVGGYGWAVFDAQKTGGYASLTALIPSIIGLIITIAGGIATNEKMRKHAMHAAILIALLGFLAIAGRLFPALFSDKPINQVAFASQAITAVLLAVLIALGVNSFIQARRNRVS